MDTNENVLDTKVAISENKKMRFSGIEALRIIAIFLICLCHALDTSVYYVDYSPTLKFPIVLLRILMSSGQIGNVLFIICSAYFLLDSKKTKAEKAFNMLLDSTLISIFIFISFLISGYSFTLENWIRHFLPDLFEHNWFIGIYVLMYAIHPLLNTVIFHMNKKSLFTFCLAVFIFFGIPGVIFWDEIAAGNLAKFIMVYFITAYVKLYCSDFSNNRKKNIKWFFIFLGMFCAQGIIAKTMPILHPYLSRFMMLEYWFSPITLPMLFFLFNIFKSFKFQSKIVNYLASCSLFVYLFHENLLLKTITRPQYYQYVMTLNSKLYFWWIMLCAVGMFMGGMILSFIYKETFHRLTLYLSKKIAKCYYKFRDYIYFKFYKEELLSENTQSLQENLTNLNIPIEENTNNNFITNNITDKFNGKDIYNNEIEKK